MKPMLIVIALGVGFASFLFYLGASKPDGVVAEKPYESAVNFEETVKDAASVKDVVDNFTAKRENGKIVVSFKLRPEKSKYSNIKVEKAMVTAPTGNPKLLTKVSDGVYILDENIKSGWYNFQIFLNADNKTIELKESVHFSQE